MASTTRALASCPSFVAAWVLVALCGCPAGGGEGGGDDEIGQDTSSEDEGTGDEDTGDETEGGEDEGEPSGNDLDQDQLFTCVDAPAMSPADLRLIDRYSWTRNVGSWHGTDLDRNPLYARPEHRYSSYAEDETLDPSVLSLYLDSVVGVGLPWAQTASWQENAITTVTDDPELHCFIGDAAPSPECTQYYVERLLERGAHYRPPTDEQVDRLVEFAQAALAMEADPEARTETIGTIVTASYVTVDALFRSELGDGRDNAAGDQLEADAHGRLRLSPHELAQAMAYAIAKTAPNAPSVRRKHLFQSKGDVDGYLAGFTDAALDGSLSDPAVVDELVREYLGGVDELRRDLYLERADDRHWDNRSEYWMGMGVRAFFREWLDYGDLAAKPPKVEVAHTSAYEGISSVEKSYQNQVDPFYGYENTFVEHLDDMIARILESDTAIFEQLLTSRMFYTPATAGYQEGESTIWKSTAEMNKAYNVAGVTEATREARWIELPANERAGVLTHPAWLGAHGLSFENDPNLVHRGKWIREELLCQDIPDLPLNVDAALSEESKELSARERISTQIDADPYCWSCHSLMNPLGYPFEIYNHAGFLRVDDHGSAPDGSSELTAMPSPELDGPVSSAIDFNERLAASPYAKRCFLRQVFRYFVGREETLADACTLVAMEQAYVDSEGSFAAVLTALFTSDSFQLRVQD